MTNEEIEAIRVHLEIVHPDGTHPLEASKALELISTIRELQTELEGERNLHNESVKIANKYRTKFHDLQAENERVLRLMPEVCSTCNLFTNPGWKCSADKSEQLPEDYCMKDKWVLKDAK